MAQYPDNIATPRTMENRPGVVYDETKTKRIYAEDFNNDRAEIVAIETEIGTNAKGAYESVRAWLEALASAIGGIVTDFLGLSDTPASYVDQAGKVVAVNATEDALEFIDAPGGAVDSVNGQTGTVVLDADDLDDAVTTNKFATADELSKLAGIEDGAEVNNISDANATDLTDGGETALHSHAGGGGVGGLYGINVQSLAGNKTLTPDTDQIYQFLDPNGANRTITLAIAGVAAGKRFVIFCTDAYNHTDRLYIQQAGAGSYLDTLFAGVFKEFIFDGTNWQGVVTGSGTTNTDRNYNIAIGQSAKATSKAIAIGINAESNYGIAIGNNSKGATIRSLVFGDSAEDGGYSYSVSLGYYSKPYRYSEISKNFQYSATQKDCITIGNWALRTTNNTPAEMFCGDESNQRFKIRPSSVLSFILQITARDNVGNAVAAYHYQGVIKRDASNNTTLVNATQTYIQEEDASWDVAISADDTNDALKILVTGDSTNPVQWVARLDGVETHF